MQKSTALFPSIPVTFTGQSLISHAGLTASLASWTHSDSAGCAKTGWASSSPPAQGTGPAGCSALGGDARRRRRTRLGPGHPAFLARGLRSAALERDGVPVLRPHRGPPGTVQLRLRNPHPGTAARDRCENRIKTLKKHRPGQAAVLRFRRQPGLGQHRRPRLQPRVLAPARRPPGRTPGQSLGHKTLALPALRDRRENHHPRPPQPAPAPGISARERPPETPPGQHRPPRQKPRSYYRLSNGPHPVPTNSPITGSGTRANPSEPTATPDCPKTENNHRSTAGTKPRPSPSIMKNRG